MRLNAELAAVKKVCNQSTHGDFLKSDLLADGDARVNRGDG